MSGNEAAILEEGALVIQVPMKCLLSQLAAQKLDSSFKKHLLKV